jgi:hypothetical protein
LPWLRKAGWGDRDSVPGERAESGVELTTYHLHLGYNACDGDYADQFEKLVQAAEHLKKRSCEILESVQDYEPTLRAGADEFVGDELLSNPENRRLTVRRGGDLEDRHENFITLWASTSGPQKYAVRRAMVRLIMQECHSHGIEVCVEVA